MDKTVGGLLSEDYRRALVFQRYGIDFCCGGKRRLSEVCKEKGIKAAKVMEELLAVKGSKEKDYSKMGIQALIDHILETHHNYLKENLPQISQILEKVVKVHGQRHPELFKAKEVFGEIVGELTPHMLKEEQVLFPHMCSKDNSEEPAACFSSVRSPIAQMEAEHEAVGEMLRSLRKICSEYKAPADACTSFKTLYALFEDLEKDVHKHIHLENNILFKKAMEAEE